MAFGTLAFGGIEDVTAADASRPETAKDEALALETALDRALRHNLGLAISRYEPANALDAIVVEESAFDFNLFGSTGADESRAAASGSSLDSASIPQSSGQDARVGADKRFATGATVTFDTGLRRSTSNNNAARNPDVRADVGLRLRQPLLKDAWPRVNLAPIARARAAADQSVFALRGTILDLLLRTEIAYWNLAFARADHALISSSIELAETLLEENRERERLGLVTPLEVLQAETELINRREDLIQAERAIEDAQDELRRAMGGTSFTDRIENEVLVERLPREAPVLRPLDTVVRQTVRFDADAGAQERAIEVERINALLARDDTRPDLDLVAGLEYLGRDSEEGRAFRGAYNRDGRDWSIGLELNFPWGFREARARARQAERNLERAKLRLYDIKQEKALAARTSWRAVRAGIKRVEVTRKSLELNEETFEQERARYGSGIVAYRRVLEAQRDLDDARGNYLSAVIETIRAEVRLSRVDGSILERNGYAWEELDALAEAPGLTDHPLHGEFETNP